MRINKLDVGLWTHLWGLSAELLQLWLTEGGDSGQTEVCKFVEFLKEEMDCHDGNLVTVREMNAF